MWVDNPVQTGARTATHDRIFLNLLGVQVGEATYDEDEKRWRWVVGNMSGFEKSRDSAELAAESYGGLR